VNQLGIAFALQNDPSNVKWHRISFPFGNCGGYLGKHLSKINSPDNAFGLIIGLDPLG